jgi:transcriptional regulator with XRE-family HTH domain
MQKTVISREYRVFLDLLRDVRQEQGTTQVELAERLQETQSFVSKCERGERRLDLLEVRHWCASLGVSFPEFIQQLEQQLKGMNPSEGRKRRNSS